MQPSIKKEEKPIIAERLREVSIPSISDASDGVMYLAKRNILTMSEHLNEPIGNFPVPGVGAEHIVDFIHDLVYNDDELRDWEDTGDYQYLLLGYAIVQHPKTNMEISPDEQPLESFQRASDLCYFLAVHNISIKRKDWMPARTRELLYGIKLKKIKECGKHRNNFYQHIAECGLELAYNQTDRDKIKLPKEMLQYFISNYTTEDMILEICRLQGLAPSTVRRDDPLQALISTWKVLRDNM